MGSGLEPGDGETRFLFNAAKSVRKNPEIIFERMRLCDFDSPTAEDVPEGDGTRSQPLNRPGSVGGKGGRRGVEQEFLSDSLCVIVASAVDSWVDWRHSETHSLEQGDGKSLIIAHKEDGIPVRENPPVSLSLLKPMENDIRSREELGLQKPFIHAVSEDLELKRDAEMIECVAHRHEAVDSLLDFDEPSTEPQHQGFRRKGRVWLPGFWVFERNRPGDGVGKKSDPVGVKMQTRLEHAIDQGVAHAENAIEKLHCSVEFEFKRGPIRMDDADPSFGLVQICQDGQSPQVMINQGSRRSLASNLLENPSGRPNVA